jgi:hypothetical protein
MVPASASCGSDQTKAQASTKRTAFRGAGAELAAARYIECKCCAIGCRTRAYAMAPVESEPAGHLGGASKRHDAFSRLAWSGRALEG